MNHLEYQLFQICERNRDGSHATQANRKSMLSLFTEQLKASGFKIKKMRCSDIKGRHINALVNIWMFENKSVGTIKNRMTVLRWWCEKVGKSEVIKNNSNYGIENRIYVTNQNKAISLNDLDLSKIDPFIAQSLRLQQFFGLRREESMKFQPFFALDGQIIDNAKYIRLKSSWTKGGRARTIPIFSEKQRQELRNALALAQNGSLIPSQKTYKAHLASFETITHQLGVGRTHGLRHGYAQARYFFLMNIQCPSIAGHRELSVKEKEQDKKVRMQISGELGHSRINITSIYLGSWSKK